MKKIRFFKIGSKNEVDFLNNMLSNNYLLKRKNGCLYTFSENDHTSKNLVVENLDKELVDLENKLISNSDNQISILKKRFLAPYYVNYTYLKGEFINNSSNEISDKYLLDFFSYRENQLLVFGNFLIILSVFIILLIEILFDNFLGGSMPLIFLISFSFWLLTLFCKSSIKKQKRILENKLGLFEMFPRYTLTVAFKNLSKAPDVSQLSFLGSWRFIVEKRKKQEFYYKLDASVDISREDIKNDISSVLNIDKELISISSPQDLIGLRF